MTTSFLKQQDIQKSWILVDAKDAVVGRLAAFLSKVLRGKNSPSYTPHMDCGQNVVVINADKVVFSGKKLENKIYYRHTGYPGGIKSSSPKKVLLGKNPCDVLRLAVKRMLDDGPMARRRLSNLYLYSGQEHKQQAQQPKLVDFGSLNKKNKR